jgi:hypothetical protein
LATKRKLDPSRHVMPLNTPTNVSAEMCRVYRAFWNQKLTVDVMSKLIFALERIRTARVAEAEMAEQRANNATTTDHQSVSVINIIGIPPGYHFTPEEAAAFTAPDLPPSWDQAPAKSPWRVIEHSAIEPEPAAAGVLK